MAGRPQGMTILMGAEVPAHPHGGVAHVLYNLQRQLRGEGIQADLLFLDAVPGWLRTVCPSRLAFPLFFGYLAVARRKQYDLVQGHGTSGWIYGVARRLFRTALPPYVLLSFELENLVWRAEQEEALLKRTTIRWTTRLFYPLTKLLPLQVALRTADHLIISHHDLDYVKARFTHYTVQENSVSAEDFAEGPRSAGGPVGVLFNLTWHWRKGIWDLPDLFRKILALDGVSITLVTPAPPPWVLQMVAQSPGRFQVYSDVPREVLQSLYRAHQIFVDPSVSSCFPLLVVLEAMASGMAVVATAVRYADHLIEHGENGYLVTPRDVDGMVGRIRQLAQDAARRQVMGQRAQQTARHHVWARTISAYVRVYQAVRAPS